MNEQAKPLEIAFMGWDARLTARTFDDFARDNREQVARKGPDRLILYDGTRITAFPPSRVRRFFDGYRFDQLILADDSRELIRGHCWEEIEIIRHNMIFSCVPEEYQILFYNTDAPAPEEMLTHGFEEIGRAMAEIGVSADAATNAFRQISEALEKLTKGGNHERTF